MTMMDTPVSPKQRIAALERQLAEIDRDTIRKSVGLSANALRDLLEKVAEQKKPIQLQLKAEQKAARDRGE